MSRRARPRARRLPATGRSALIAGTLCEVLPDGAATRISYGILNLTHRDGHEAPAPLEPGSAIACASSSTTSAIASGRAIACACAISNAYWPIVWPSPEANLLSIHCGDSALSLPVRDSKRSMDGETAGAAGTAGSPRHWQQTQIEAPRITVGPFTLSAMTGETILTRMNDDGFGAASKASASNSACTASTHTRSRRTDPLSAGSIPTTLRRYRRGTWAVTGETRVTLTVDTQ